jgi:arsenite methyltransferase
VTLQNAQAEGMADRVEVKTATCATCPFQMKQSTWSSPVCPFTTSRRKTIVRIVKPGGRVALLDFQCTDEYVQTLHEAGRTPRQVEK